MGARARKVDPRQITFDHLLLFAAELEHESASGRKTRRVTAHGETRSVYEWADVQGISPQTIYGRLERGYTSEAAIARFRPSRSSGTDADDIPPGEPCSLSWDLLEWAEDPWAWRVVAAHGAMDLATIGMYLGLSTQRVEELEKDVFAKMRLATELESVLGIQRAEQQMERLRGEPVEAFERAVRRARKLLQWEAEAASKQKRPT